MKIKNPLLIDPELAQKIGLNESIILQQLIYWIDKNRKKNTNYKDGMYWTFNSLRNWQKQFSFWSKDTIHRTLRNLAKKKIIYISNFNRLDYDKTCWYSVNDSLLNDIMLSQVKTNPSQDDTGLSQNAYIDDSKMRHGYTQNETTIPETNTETIQILTSETTAETTEEKESVRGKEEKSLSAIQIIDNAIKHCNKSFSEQEMLKITEAFKSNVNIYKLSENSIVKLLNQIPDANSLDRQKVFLFYAQATSMKEVGWYG